MNEMDRVKYLERRMAEEVEGKKRKEEMVCGYLKLKLDHEEKSVTLNKAKLTDQWRWASYEMYIENPIKQSTKYVLQYH